MGRSSDVPTWPADHEQRPGPSNPTTPECFFESCGNMRNNSSGTELRSTTSVSLDTTINNTDTDIDILI